MSERIENLVKELQTACEEENFSLIVNAQAVESEKAVIAMSGSIVNLGLNLAVLENALESKLELSIDKLKVIGLTKGVNCDCDNCKSKKSDGDPLLAFLETLLKISKRKN